MPPILETDLLKTFIAITQTGSFSKAAEQVHKSQGAISMQMKRLEEIVGRPVFQKKGRQNVLTPDGDRLLDYAHRITKLHDEAVATFRQPELTGLVSLGTPDDYADKLLPEILARFTRSHPNVQIDVVCQSSQALAQAIDQNHLDLSIVTTSASLLTQTVIRHEELVWVTSYKHSAHSKDVIPLALSHTGCSWRQMAIDSIESTNKQYRIAYASGNANAIYAAVMAGIAIAAVPRLVVKPGMRILTEQDGFPPPGSFDIGLLRSTNAKGCAIDALNRHIIESFGNVTVQIGAQMPSQMEAAE